MPKIKWIYFILSLLMLASGIFYWQKEEARAASVIAYETDQEAARKLSSEENEDAAETGPVDVFPDDTGIPGAASPTAAETADAGASEGGIDQEEGTESGWIYATEPLRVNINTADTAELEKLPGIGPSKAAAIISYRETHGAFGCPEDLMKVPGIKEGTFGKLADYVEV